MTTVPRPRRLRREDPLSAPPSPAPATAAPTPAMIIPPQTEEPPTEPQWRDWTAETAMKSFRLPVKLLSELAGRSDATGVPVGHLVTGYLTAGLDASDAEAIAWADRAQRALTAGKRNARRKDNR